MTNPIILLFLFRVLSGRTVEKQKKRFGIYKLQCFCFGRHTGWVTLKINIYITKKIFSGSKYAMVIRVIFENKALVPRKLPYGLNEALLTFAHPESSEF